MVPGGLTGWLVGPEGAIGSVKLVPIFDPQPHQGMDKVVKNPRVFADS